MKRVLLTIMILALLQIPALAFELENSQLELQIQDMRGSGTEYVNAYTGSEPQGDDFSFGFDEAENIYEYDFKSPKKAFIYSLIVPGLGERYTKSNVLKSLFFLGVEAGMWMSYFSFHNDGEKLTDKFQDYANVNWSEQAYRDWIIEYDVDEDTLTHELPETKDQQFYEMIGKYEQFRGGWSDYIPGENDSTISPFRESYNTQRQKANDKLDQANSFIILSMVNHLLSAFDSALAAKRHNKNKAAEMWLSVRAEMKKYSATESIPILKISCRF
ncbi:MAG: hypothetical protein AB1746_09350 [Candidatus Zixiibacteriota bacterium]